MTLVVGIDCATVPAKTGLALGHFEDGMLLVKEVVQGSQERPPYQIAARWLAGVPTAVVALDAPLGWPRPLAESLVNHEAGTPLGSYRDANPLFSRTTDILIENQLKKRPLEVGANLIARTAHAALLFLADLRRELGRPIPLSWVLGPPEDVVAVEVYPAATRLAHGMPEGRGSLEGLRDWVTLPSGAREAPVDARDAVLCAGDQLELLELHASLAADRRFLLGDFSNSTARSHTCHSY